MDEKEQVQNEIAYFMTLSFLREMYKTGKYELKILEIANKNNADRFGCIAVSIA